jgi:F0F1-type ATP synthase membrane subunit c/vacuolar-type H+-ATPase subunit K
MLDWIAGGILGIMVGLLVGLFIMVLLEESSNVNKGFLFLAIIEFGIIMCLIGHFLL